MPRLEDGKDELGIRYQGDVLTGKRSVEEAMQLAALETRGLMPEEVLAETGERQAEAYPTRAQRGGQAEGGGQAKAYPTGTPAEVVEGILRRARGR